MYQPNGSPLEIVTGWEGAGGLKATTVIGGSSMKLIWNFWRGRREVQTQNLSIGREGIFS